MTITIKTQWNDTNLYKSNLDTLRAALEAAVGEGANLRGADLRGADLRSANLRGADLEDADLRSADLRGADLEDADLRGADLEGANLRGADLRGADLEDADLGSADLRGADLEGAKINWQSHDVLAELLFRAADQDVEKRKVAGLILISRDWCWRKFMSLNDPLKDWTLDILAAYAADDESAPNVLREHVKRQQPVEEEKEASEWLMNR